MVSSAFNILEYSIDPIYSYHLQGIPIIIIGHHILYGKVANLDKPYIVLIKNSKSTTSDPSVSDSGDLNDSAAMDTDNPKDEDSDGIYYKVSAAIKRKIVFKTRPKPIITYVPKKWVKKSRTRLD